MVIANLNRVLAATLILIVSGCSASKKAFKEAKEYEKKGLYVESAEADLKALRKDSKFADAKAHLREVAPKAYDELRLQAENLELAENWDLAVTAYEKLSSFIDRCARRGVVFETINTRARLAKVKRSAANYHYKNGERFFRAKDWGKAANAFLKAHKQIANYNKSMEKAIQSLVNAGNSHLKAGYFDAALHAFGKILEVAPGHSHGKKKMAQTHFMIGKQLFAEEQFRKSYQAFLTAAEFDSEHRAVAEWTEKAYREAVRFVAVIPFQNNTDLAIDGSLMASDIHNKLSHENLDFADFMSHPEVMELMDKTSLSRYGTVSESELLSIAEEADLSAIIWGVVRDVNIGDSPEQMSEVSHNKVIVVQDSSGKDVETTETIFYREYSRRRKVEVRIETRILEVKTGAILDNQRYREEITDVARWIGYSGSIYDLPEDKRALLDAPRDPRPVGILINEMLKGATERLTRDLVNFLR